MHICRYTRSKTACQKFYIQRKVGKSIMHSNHDAGDTASAEQKASPCSQSGPWLMDLRNRPLPTSATSTHPTIRLPCRDLEIPIFSARVKRRDMGLSWWYLRTHGFQNISPSSSSSPSPSPSPSSSPSSSSSSSSSFSSSNHCGDGLHPDAPNPSTSGRLCRALCIKWLHRSPRNVCLHGFGKKDGFIYGAFPNWGYPKMDGKGTSY